MNVLPSRSKIGLSLRYFSGLSRLAARKYRTLPVEPRKIVFNNFQGLGFGDHQRCIAAELMRRGLGLDIVWLVKDDAAAGSLPPGVRSVRYGSEASFHELSTARVWCSNQSFTSYVMKGLVKKPGQVYVQTFHGALGIKRIGADQQNGGLRRFLSSRVLRCEASMVDYLIANAAWEADFVYRRRFFDHGEVKLFGHPRNDVFFADGSALRESVRQAFGIGPEERIVFCAPTHRDGGSVEGLPRDPTAVASACGRRFGGKWRFMYRLHPNLRARARELDFGPAVVDATSYPDMQDLLVASDVLMSDYSSCMFDFMLTRRPVVVYAPDLAHYESGRGFYYPMSETPFPVAQDERALQDCILGFDDARYHADVEAFLKGKGCVEDGHATERTADLIEGLMRS